MIHEKIYSKEIDCFRGIAVLAVIFYHLPNSKLPGGLQGVTIFFVVSGFLMAKNTIRDEKTDNSVFYIFTISVSNVFIHFYCFLWSYPFSYWGSATFD